MLSLPRVGHVSELCPRLGSARPLEASMHDERTDLRKGDAVQSEFVVRSSCSIARTSVAQRKDYTRVIVHSDISNNLERKREARSRNKRQAVSIPPFCSRSCSLHEVIVFVKRGNFL